MRRAFTLTAGQPNQSINVDFEVVSVVVSNPTGSPVYVRTGAPDIPDAGNASVIVPAATAQAFPVGGRSFGFAIGDTTLLTSSAASLSGLFGSVTLTLLGHGEQLPSYGSYSFLNLSLSDLTGGLVAFSGATVTRSFDLGAWGGALLTVLPDASGGQGRVSVNVSDDDSAYSVLGEWAFWPGVPLTLTLPRTVRYLRVSLALSGISGEPAPSGSYALRATLAEVTDVRHSPSSAPISQPYSIAALGTQSFTLATAGLQSIAVTLKRATGSAAQLLVESSSSPTGPWVIASNREQILAGGLNDSIYRSIGNLDLYTRITINEIANVPMTGTFTAVIPSDADTTSLLTSIYSALGDIGQTPNVGQSIYHQLANLNTAAGDSSSAAGDTDLIGQLLQVVASLGTSGSTRNAASVIGQLLQVVASLGTTTGRGSASVLGQLLQIAWALTTPSTTGGISDNVYTSLLAFGIESDNAVTANTLIGTNKGIRNYTSLNNQILAAMTLPVSTTGGLPDNIYTELDWIRTNTNDRALGVYNVSGVGTGALVNSGIDVGGGICMISVSANAAGLIAIRSGTSGAAGSLLWQGYVGANVPVVIPFQTQTYSAMAGNTRIWTSVPAGASFAIILHAR